MEHPVTISVRDNVVHYHVFGDNREFYDKTSVVISHPEMEQFMMQHGHDLERELLQMKENFDLE